MSPRSRRTSIALGVAVWMASWLAIPGPSAHRPMARRLLAPFASAAAGITWLRAERAAALGAHASFVARAEQALALDPAETAYWEMLAHHQAYYLGSPERESDPARRLEWLRAALDTAERGEHQARDPGALALWRGLCLWAKASDDLELPWPGGADAMRASSRAALEHAAELGDARARAALAPPGAPGG